MRRIEEIAKDKRVEIEKAGPGWFVGTVKLTGDKPQYILISDRNFYNVPASLPQ